MLSAFIFINILYIGFISSLILFLFKAKDVADINKSVGNEPLSLLIPIRNESDNLKALLRSIKKIRDEFNNVDIFLVDDNSEDNSGAQLKEWLVSLKQSERINIIHITDQISSKKKAVNEALKKVKTNWIVQSDADCDISLDWIKSINSMDKSKLAFIAGPVVFKSNGFWEKFLTVESWALVLVSYLGFKIRQPQMCSAANMAWNKSELGTNSYSDIINMNTPSGDDAFLLEYFKNSKVEALKYNWDRKALVYTLPPKSFSEFIHQRLRWASKWGSIKGVSQVVFPFSLWVYHLLHIFFLLVLISNKQYIEVLLVILLKMGFEALMLRKVAKNFNASISLVHVLLMQLFYSPYVVILGFLSQFKNYRWKKAK